MRREVTIHLDLFPEKSREEVAALIRRRVGENAREREKTRGRGQSIENSFIGFVHKKLIAVLLKEAGVGDLRRPCGEMSEEEIRRVAEVMKDWPLRCTGTQSWMHSQVTAGGVDVQEVDPRTMQSRLAPGVFFAGEVLDVDGESGGYNLQWAWSSGYVAGQCAAG